MSMTSYRAKLEYLDHYARRIASDAAAVVSIVGRMIQAEAVVQLEQKADQISDFNDVWGGAGPDFSTSTPVLTGVY